MTNNGEGRTLSPPADALISPALPLSLLADHDQDDAAGSDITALPAVPERPTRRKGRFAASGEHKVLSGVAIAFRAPRSSSSTYSLHSGKNLPPVVHSNEFNLSSPTATSSTGTEGKPNTINAAELLSATADEVSSDRRHTLNRSGKGRFHSFNPRAILASRRSSCTASSKIDDINLRGNSRSVPALPLDYDPRIRGNIVHDFSIPKIQRPQCNGLSSADNSPLDPCPSTPNLPPVVDSPSAATPSISGPQSSTHAPIFKEHFDDAEHSTAPQPHSTGYLHSLATSAAAYAAADPPELPAFAKSLPLNIFEALEPVGEDSNMEGMGVSSARMKEKEMSPTPRETQPQINPQTLSIDPKSLEADALIPEDRIAGRTTSVAQHKKPDQTFPRHTTSTSSRFSFQLGDVGSETEERLLEERHKRRAAYKMGERGDGSDWISDGYSDIDEEHEDDEGLEEKIPGVNADSDDDPSQILPSQVLPVLGAGANVASSSLEPSSGTASDSNGPSSENRDFDVSNEVSHLRLGQTDTPISDMFDPADSTSSMNGLGISTVRPKTPNRSRDSEMESQSGGYSRQLQGNEDTVDDDQSHVGCIGEEVRPESSFLSRQNGYLNGAYSNNGINHLSAQDKASQEALQEDWTNDLSRETGEHEASDPSNSAQIAGSPVGPKGQISETLSEIQAPFPLRSDGLPILGNTGLANQDGIRSDGLTEHNLAYQDSLIMASENASNEPHQGFPGRIGYVSDQPAYSNSGSRGPSYLPLKTSWDGETCDRAILDDATGPEPEHGMEEDLIIAEANAEALENDEDGFYGQEFGFFARAPTKGDAQLVHGGFFGPRGIEGVQRSHSAKARFVEPSLTPITERSERSHRNSMASTHAMAMPHGSFAVTGPGLAPLVDSPFAEDDMLSAPLKLWLETLGGSQTSLSSTGASQTSSLPLTGSPVRDFIGPPPPMVEGRKRHSDGVIMHSPLHATHDQSSVIEGEEDPDELDDADTPYSFDHNSPPIGPVDGTSPPSSCHDTTPSSPTQTVPGRAKSPDIKFPLGL